MKLWFMHVLLLCVSAYAQTPSSAVFSPYPAYSDGKVLANVDLASPIVAWDVRTGDYLVLRRDGGRVGEEVRLKGSRNLSPVVSVKITQVPGGAWEYMYSFENGRSAADRIGEVSLVLPTHVKVLSRSSPPNWRVSQRLALDPGEVVEGWTPLDLAASVGSGVSRTGFQLTSAETPGFLPARVHAADIGSSDRIKAAPEPIQELVRNVQRNGFDSAVVLTIGPKFPPGTNRIAILADFHEGLQVLLKQRHLSETSEFIADLRAALRTYLNAIAQAADVPAEEFIGPSVRVAGKPATALEAQIHAALKTYIPEM
jgi:hypothetical protein